MTTQPRQAASEREILVELLSLQKETSAGISWGSNLVAEKELRMRWAAAWNKARAALSTVADEAAPPPLLVPLGWKLVPIEPTPEMVDKGGHVNSEWLNDNAPIGEVRYAMPMPGVWKAMLAASPLPGKVLTI